ncbi:lipopolysaccharide biosynthesis protein [Vibrio maritimus]
MKDIASLTRLHSIVLAFDKVFYLILSIGTARLFSLAEFGKFQSILFQVGIFATFIGAALPFIINDYIKGNLGRLNNVLLHLMKGVVYLLTITFAVCLLFLNDELTDYVLLALPLLIFQILVPLAKQAFIISSSIKISILTNAIIYPSAIAAIALLHKFDRLTYSNIIHLLTAVYALIFISAFSYHIIKYKNVVRKAIDVRMFGSSIAMKTMLVVSLSALYENVDQLFVSWMYSPELFAIYRVGNFRLPFIEIITGAVAAVLIAKVPKLYSKDDFVKLKKEWKEATSKNTKLLLPIIIFCTITAQYVVTFLFGSEYDVSSKIYTVYLMKFILASITLAPVIISFGGAGILTKALLVLLIAELCILYLCFHLIPEHLLVISCVALLFQYLSILCQAKILRKSYKIMFSEVFDFKVFLHTLTLSIVLSLISLAVLENMSVNLNFAYPTVSIIYYGIIQYILKVKGNDSLSCKV